MRSTMRKFGWLVVGIALALVGTEAGVWNEAHRFDEYIAPTLAKLAAYRQTALMSKRASSCGALQAPRARTVAK